MAQDNDIKAFIEQLKNAHNNQEILQQEAIQDLTDLQLFNRVLLEREAKRLESKLGKDHPRVKKIEDGLTQNLHVLNVLSNEQELKRLKVTEAAKDETLLHGRITNMVGHGIIGTQIILKNSAGDTVATKELKTDETGYFSFKFDARALAKISDEKIFITITDNYGKILHQPTEPLIMQKGEHKLLRTVINSKKIIGKAGMADQPTGGTPVKPKKAVNKIRKIKK